ncbi:MAG: hypothetical protein MUD03_13335 [Pirellula sp.]|nr:hypothetical protein [Pirellula sp.]
MITHTQMKMVGWRLGAATLALGWFGAGSVEAQQGPAIAYPVNSWSFTERSSTVDEGFMRGQASIIGAVGELSYMNSLAAINYQEAQRRAIDNSVAYTKAYFERRELREEFVRRYGSKPFVGEARRRMVEYYQPKKLSASQYNHDTGVITWPHILRQPQYAPLKKEIDSIFATRNWENSGSGSPTQLQVAQLVKSLAALLRENLLTMSAEQYVEAQEFLRSVDAEAKLPVIQKVEQAAAPVEFPGVVTTPVEPKPAEGAPTKTGAADGAGAGEASKDTNAANSRSENQVKLVSVQKLDI